VQRNGLALQLLAVGGTEHIWFKLCGAIAGVPYPGTPLQPSTTVVPAAPDHHRDGHFGVVVFRLIDVRILQILGMYTYALNLGLTHATAVCGIPLVNSFEEVYLEAPGCAFRWNDEIAAWHAKNTGLRFEEYLAQLDCYVDKYLINGLRLPGRT
jgi:hypothetical protein